MLSLTWIKCLCFFQFDFEEPSRTGHLWDAFSLSDFAPTKLFPEDEQSLVSVRSVEILVQFWCKGKNGLQGEHWLEEPGRSVRVLPF